MIDVFLCSHWDYIWQEPLITTLWCLALHSYYNKSIFFSLFAYIRETSVSVFPPSSHCCLWLMVRQRPLSVDRGTNSKWDPFKYTVHTVLDVDLWKYISLIVALSTRRTGATKVADIDNSTYLIWLRTRCGNQTDADSAIPPHTHLFSLLSIFRAFSLLSSCLIFPSVTNLCLTFSWQRAAILHHITQGAPPPNANPQTQGTQILFTRQSCTLGSVVRSILAQIWDREMSVWWCHRRDEQRLRSLLSAPVSTVPVYRRVPPQHIIL